MSNGMTHTRHNHTVCAHTQGHENAYSLSNGWNHLNVWKQTVPRKENCRMPAEEEGADDRPHTEKSHTLYSEDWANLWAVPSSSWRHKIWCTQLTMASVSICIELIKIHDKLSFGKNSQYCNGNAYVALAARPAPQCTAQKVPWNTTCTLKCIIYI